MLNILRKKENIKKIMWTLALLIIPAFVLWGSGSAVRSRGLPKYAGRIFGKKISFRQYETSFRACRNQALLIYGEDFNQVVKSLDLEEQAWERLILLHQAKTERTKVSDREVVDFIREMPLFQKEGRFDQLRYNTLLNYAFHASPREFEEQIRDALKIEQLKNKFIGQLSLSDEEIKEAYRYENEKAKAFYVLFELEKFKDQLHPSYEELQDYYQKQKTEFKKPEQVNVQYIALYFDRHQPEVSVSAEEIADYYSAHPEQFSIKGETPETKPLEEVKAQIIREKTRAILEDKIWQVSDEIADNPQSFEDVAKQHQLEVKETGFFGPQQVIPEIGLSYEFLNTAFSLKVDELSNVIETPKGYFIIKIIGKKEPYIPALNEIEEAVKSAVLTQKAWQLAEKQGEELAGQIKQLMQDKKLSFVKAAESLSLTVKETEEFSRFDYISGIGQNITEFTRGAFKLEPGEVSGLIIVPNGYCILSLKEVLPIDEMKFTQEKEVFAKILLAKKKEVYFQIWLANLKKKANLVNNIEKLRDQRSP